MGDNKTTSTSSTKAISLGHLNIIRSYIDKEIAKKTDGIVTGYEDVKCIGLPESTTFVPVDLFNCGSCDVYSYKHITGIDSILNKPTNLTGPFVLVRNRTLMTDGDYKDKYLIKTVIFTPGVNHDLLSDCDPLIFTNQSIFDPITGKGYAADGITYEKWTEVRSDDLIVNEMIMRDDEIYLTDQHDLTSGLAIRSLNDVTNISKIKDLPDIESADNIASVRIRSTIVGVITDNKVKYIVQELNITHNDDSKKPYLRFLSAPNYDNDFIAGVWEEMTLLDFKEISVLGMIHSLKKNIDKMEDDMEARLESYIDDTATKLESDIDSYMNELGDNLESKIENDFSARLSKLGFKWGGIPFIGRMYTPPANNIEPCTSNGIYRYGKGVFGHIYLTNVEIDKDEFVNYFAYDGYVDDYDVRRATGNPFVAYNGGNSNTVGIPHDFTPAYSDPNHPFINCYIRSCYTTAMGHRPAAHVLLHVDTEGNTTLRELRMTGYDGIDDNNSTLVNMAFATLAAQGKYDIYMCFGYKGK